jgi:2-iminobutanoate/2-iminopropanoate deaminase
MQTTIQTDNAPVPLGPYSQAIRAHGFIFVSGQIPVDPEKGTLVESNIEIQARQVLKNLEAILTAAGSSLSKVVKTTLYLIDLKDFPSVNRVYEEFLGKVKPARATVQVARLPMDAMIEIDAVALT